MNTHYQGTQNEPTSEAKQTAVSPVNLAELSASPPATSPEIEQVFQQIKAERSQGHFSDYLRYLLTYEERKPVDPTFALQMKFDDMLAVLFQESRKRAWWKRISIGTGLSLLVVMISRSIYTRDFTFHSLFALGVPLSLLFVGTPASRKQQAVVAAITQFDDVRAVGPLAEALDFPGEQIAPIVQKTLIRLLPRLKASHSSLLNSTQRACLSRALQAGNPALTLAILKAWEQVGDEDAIPEVQRLAEGRDLNAPLKEKKGGETQKQLARRLMAKTAKRLLTLLIGEERPGIAPEDRSVLVAAARECLPLLRQSVENRQIGSQLLRPSDSSVTSSDVLLRPVGSHSSTEPPNQLLRPSDDSG